MTWELLVALGAAVVGTAGAAGLVTALNELTKPARLRRQIDGLVKTREEVDAGETRDRLTSVIHELAEELAAHIRLRKRRPRAFVSAFKMALFAAVGGVLIVEGAIRIRPEGNPFDRPGFYWSYVFGAAAAGWALGFELVMRRKRAQRWIMTTTIPPLRAPMVKLYLWGVEREKRKKNKPPSLVDRFYAWTWEPDSPDAPYKPFTDEAERQALQAGDQKRDQSD
ncbi:hypothetical protein [Jiangella anatolica]|uniref:Uncharacterized protein n=1 Tax=Jiangella anatolica TaxID=2670374 RepID=A0A2W2BGR0_9ACTN|nr:hypothetical protein [Jiangella anatolica]PZF85162.1 hypothetical protein C1I92_06180 [Jiangella anatolica]